MIATMLLAVGSKLTDFFFTAEIADYSITLDNDLQVSGILEKVWDLAYCTNCGHHRD